MTAQTLQRSRHHCHAHCSIRSMNLVSSPVVIATLLGLWLLGPHQARALRPFDSTDAETAKPRTLELEMGLAELRHDGTFSLASPHLVANLGIASRLELVLEASQIFFLSDRFSGAFARMSQCGIICLERPEISLKGILVAGSLQHVGPWLSLAVETGIFLPIGTKQSGAQVIFIASERLPWFTVHANAAFLVQRDQTGSTELGVVAEGPDTWPIRPVAEMTASYDKVEGRTINLLAGAIWNIQPGLSVDLAGVVEPTSLAYQVRCGLTWTISMSTDNPGKTQKGFP